jgi:hypothetical protein
MSDEKRFDQLMEQVMSGRLSRRGVLRRATALGLSVPAISMLLAACGDDDPTATPPPAAADPTPTEAEAEATPTEAEGEATPDETEEPGNGEFELDNPPEVANAEEASQYSGAQLTYYGDGVGIGSQIDETWPPSSMRPPASRSA